MNDQENIPQSVIQKTEDWTVWKWTEAVKVFTIKSIDDLYKLEQLWYAARCQITLEKEFIYGDNYKIKLITTDKGAFVFVVDNLRITFNYTVFNENITEQILQLESVIRILGTITSQVYSLTNRLVNSEMSSSKLHESIPENSLVYKAIKSTVNLVFWNINRSFIIHTQEASDLLVLITNEFNKIINYYSDINNRKFPIKYDYEKYLELLIKTRSKIQNIQSSLNNQINSQKKVCKIRWIVL